jgi:hypothetical protein
MLTRLCRVIILTVGDLFDVECLADPRFLATWNHDLDVKAYRTAMKQMR